MKNNLEDLFARIRKIRSAVYLSVDELSFKDGTTKESWLRDANQLLTDCDNFLKNLCDKDDEFRYYYEGEIGKRNNVLANAAMHDAVSEEFFGDCVPKDYWDEYNKLDSEILFRFRILEYIAKKNNFQELLENYHLNHKKEFGPITIIVDDSDEAKKCLVNGEEVNITGKRLKFLAHVLNSCYFNNGSISMIDLEKEVLITESELKKYQSEINKVFKKYFNKPIIVADERREEKGYKRLNF